MIPASLEKAPSITVLTMFLPKILRAISVALITNMFCSGMFICNSLLLWLELIITMVLS